MGQLPIYKVLGDRVKQLRHEARMTQAQLSEHSGLFRTHLSRIECGTANPSLDAIVAIACALRISPHDLLAHEAMELPGDSAR
jgi:transcriptional regulator with XRE-family HTH domain